MPHDHNRWQHQLPPSQLLDMSFARNNAGTVHSFFVAFNSILHMISSVVFLERTIMHVKVQSQSFLKVKQQKPDVRFSFFLQCGFGREGKANC